MYVKISVSTAPLSELQVLDCKTCLLFCKKQQNQSKPSETANSVCLQQTYISAAVSPIPNQRRRHAVLTGNNLTWNKSDFGVIISQLQAYMIFTSEGEVTLVINEFLLCSRHLAYRRRQRATLNRPNK
jgi:hypothetical protein